MKPKPIPLAVSEKGRNRYRPTLSEAQQLRESNEALHESNVGYIADNAILRDRIAAYRKWQPWAVAFGAVVGAVVSWVVRGWLGA